MARYLVVSSKCQDCQCLDISSRFPCRKTANAEISRQLFVKMALDSIAVSTCTVLAIVPPQGCESILIEILQSKPSAVDHTLHAVFSKVNNHITDISLLIYHWNPHINTSLLCKCCVKKRIITYFIVSYPNRYVASEREFLLINSTV